MSYELLYKADVCNPKIGQILKAKVKFIKKIGILAYNGPLNIIIGKEFHSDISLFDEINPDDILDVQVIASKFSLNDREIKVIANLKVEKENEDTNMVLGELINNMEEEDKKYDIENNKQQISDIESFEDIDNLSLESISDDEDDNEDEDDASFDNGNLDEDEEENVQENENLDEFEDSMLNTAEDELSVQEEISDNDD